MEPYKRRTLAKLGMPDSEAQSRAGADYLCVTCDEIIRLAKLSPPTLPRILNVLQIGALFGDTLNSDGSPDYCGFAQALAVAMAAGKVPNLGDESLQGPGDAAPNAYRARHAGRADAQGVRTWLDSEGVTLPKTNLATRWLNPKVSRRQTAKAKHAAILQQAESLSGQSGINKKLSRELGIPEKTIRNVRSAAARKAT